MVSQKCFGTSQNLSVVGAPPRDRLKEFGEAIREGLYASPKRLPCRFFYDQTGSELFELITDLPEYYLTRAEFLLFRTVASDIIGSLDPDFEIVEFGSGSSKKTRVLIEETFLRQNSLQYVAIDIAAEFLIDSCKCLLDSYKNLSVTAVAAEYSEALLLLPEPVRQRLFLFLGSNIGNFEDDQAIAFLRLVREQMKATDALLVGIDLAKDPEIIRQAYNDSQGVTGRFNKNLLARINLEFGADFNLTKFLHNAPYFEDSGKVEMRLVSVGNQHVNVPGINCNFYFEDGESIFTEISRKYSESGFTALSEKAGFAVDQYWFDAKRWFGLFLLRASK